MGMWVMLESIVYSVEYMMESVVFLGGGGIKVVVCDYWVVVKIGMVKKIGLDGKYIDKYVVYIVGVVFVS